MGQDILAVLSMVGTLLLVIAVFVGAYFVSRLVARRYQGGGGPSLGNLDILDRKMLGKDQSLVVVRVGERVLLLSVTPRHIEKLEELDPSSYPPRETAPQTPPSFLSVLKGTLPRKPHTEEDKDHADN